MVNYAPKPNTGNGPGGFCSRGDHPFSLAGDFIGPFPPSVGTTCFTISRVDTSTSWLFATPTRNTSVKQVISSFSKYILPHLPSGHHWLRSRSSFYFPCNTALGFPTGQPVELICLAGLRDHLSKSLLLNLQGGRWTSKRASLLPGALTTLNSRPYGHHFPYTHWTP